MKITTTSEQKESMKLKQEDADGKADLQSNYFTKLPGKKNFKAP